MKPIQLSDEQRSMLAGEQGVARQMGMRLILDLAATSGAERLIPIQSAHLSGVSPLTGGLGLRLFLQRLASGGGPGVAIPTTLNAAGCDEAQFARMYITVSGFLEAHREIINLYTKLGVRPIQSCVPYEWEDVLAMAQTGEGHAAWAESNAICFANSYCSLRTNRESGLSALASALTGYAPDYGLLQEEARRPNLAVIVTTPLDDPTDFSILGDWIGRQRQAGWQMPFGPIPALKGLPAGLTHEQRKALSAAAANYGCPLLYLDSEGPRPPAAFQGRLFFGEADLRQRYAELRPKQPVSLVVIGCPQASYGELEAVARLLRGKQVTAEPATPGSPPPLWVFTSSVTRAVAEKTGVAAAIRQSGALLLENTCPEVVPYDQSWVHHVLTNSMKAEHYIRSGLNGIPTSVMRLADCIAMATGEETGGFVTSIVSAQALRLSPKDWQFEIKSDESAEQRGGGEVGGRRSAVSGPPSPISQSPNHPISVTGRGLASQGDFALVAEAFVTDTPITFLGYVNRETGVVEEEGHPANGQSLAGKIAIFPKGTGSSVAPYVLLELFYRGKAPLAIINTEMDQQTVPACSLEGIPYAYGFDADVTSVFRMGDQVKLVRRGDKVTIRR
jgi:predicted aconitase/predicted aconitase with swiveling domain